jgi:site-specific DNA recombinase
LNGVGVPTHYVRDGRGVRGQRTRGVWRAGRVRNLLINPIYRGELLYGRRTTKREREQISASVEPLVSVELWEAGQATLRSNRLVPTTSARSYLLKGVLRCSLCGLTYVGSQGNGATWYRCGGQLVERGPLPGRCPGHAVKGEAIEPLVWADLEQLLRDPGDLLAELDLDAERDTERTVAEAEAITLTAALEALEAQRQRAVNLAIRGAISDADLDAELRRIVAERAELERRLAALTPEPEPEPVVSRDLLADLRTRLDAGLSIEQRQEIVRLLVAKIVIHTELLPDGKKTVRAVAEYRIPGVVPTRTGTGAGQNYTLARRIIELPIGRWRRPLLPAVTPAPCQGALP